MTTIRVRQAHPNRDRTIIRDLWWEYLTWANDRNDQAFGLRLDIAAMLEEDLADLDKFMPPLGRLLLSEVQGCVAGCICLKRLGTRIGEVKRLYVVPDYRGRGIGKELVGSLLDEARLIGYKPERGHRFVSLPDLGRGGAAVAVYLIMPHVLAFLAAV